MPFSRRYLPLAVLAGAILAIGPAPAQAMTVTTGSYMNTGIGAEFSSPYDTFSISGSTTRFATPFSPLEITLADYTFEVGPNCYSCSLRPSFDALIDITIDGVTKQIDLPYSWSSSGPNDFLTFGDAAPVGFDQAGRGTVTLAVRHIDVLTGAGGPVHGTLTATVLVSNIPEPGTAASMLAGLGLIGFMVRRRS